MAIKPLSTTDAAWVLLESRETPMHVSGLFEFTLPPGAPPTYLHDLFAEMHSMRNVQPPWNQKLVGAPIVGQLPAMTDDHDVDIDYHLRHSALAAPGGERELGILVSRLHSIQLDLKRPLWEIHLIEGLSGNRFAMLLKVHHALVDGTSAIRLMLRTFSTDPDDDAVKPFWTVGAGARSPEERSDDNSGGFDPVAAVQRVMSTVGKTGQVAATLAKAAADFSRASIDGGPLRAPYSAPNSALHATLTGQRRFATQQYDLERFKSLAKTAGCTLNDLVLYLSGTALRRYLQEHGTLPDRALTAGIPVNIRAGDDQSMGTSIAMIIADLATNVADPLERLATIHRSAAAAKSQMQAMPREALVPFSLAVNLPYIAGLAAGLGGKLPAPFSVGISNVPGPPDRQYMSGARLDAFFPLSLLTHGSALNITCVSYAGTLNFGLVGARDVLPHLQRLAVYMGEALDEFESIVAPKPAPKPVAKPRRTKTAGS